MTIRLQTLVSSVMLATALSAAGTVSAHHSFAMYEPEKVVTIDGVVKDFKWTNPHVIITVLASSESADANGKLWTLELPAPGQMTRNGWTHTTIKPGDMVKATLRPFRDGRLGGAFVSVIVNGEEIKR
jgi:Family of unknown function (DUF6152)